MKNTVKLFGIIALVAVIGFGMAGCGDSQYIDASTSGQLTITGLSAYEGQDIEAYAEAGGKQLIACGRTTNQAEANGKVISAGEPFPGKVSNGQAVLKVFIVTGGASGYTSYSGNDQNVQFDFTIFSGPGSVTVNFSNGKASGAFIPNP